MITINNLTKQYGNFQLQVNHLVIENTGITGIAGNNGAGKSTFLLSLADLLPVNSGEVLYNGQPIKTAAAWKKDVAMFLNSNFLLDFLTAAEYWRFVASLNTGNLPAAQLRPPAIFDDFLGGDFYTSRKIKDYSQGNKDKIGIVAALMGTARVVILDEPFAHLDPKSQAELMKLLRQRSDDTAIIVSSHHIEQLSNLSDRILVFESGLIVSDEAVSPATNRLLKQYFFS